MHPKAFIDLAVWVWLFVMTIDLVWRKVRRIRPAPAWTFWVDLLALAWAVGKVVAWVVVRCLG